METQIFFCNLPDKLAIKATTIFKSKKILKNEKNIISSFLFNIDALHIKRRRNIYTNFL